MSSSIKGLIREIQLSQCYMVLQVFVKNSFTKINDVHINDGFRKLP